jgi:hypothetical protein
VFFEGWGEGKTKKSGGKKIIKLNIKDTLFDKFN